MSCYNKIYSNNYIMQMKIMHGFLASHSDDQYQHLIILNILINIINLCCTDAKQHGWQVVIKIILDSKHQVNDYRLS